MRERSHEDSVIFSVIILYKFNTSLPRSLRNTPKARFFCIASLGGAAIQLTRVSLPHFMQISPARASARGAKRLIMVCAVFKQLSSFLLAEYPYYLYPTVFLNINYNLISSVNSLLIFYSDRQIGIIHCTCIVNLKLKTYLKLVEFRMVILMVRNVYDNSLLQFQIIYMIRFSYTLLNVNNGFQ